MIKRILKYQIVSFLCQNMHMIIFVSYSNHTNTSVLQSSTK